MSVPVKRSGNFKRLERRLERNVGKAIGDFNMIEPSDVVMVCLSGGKDSYTLLKILLALRARAPIDFKLIAMNLDQKQPGFPGHVLPEYLQSLGVSYHIEEEDTYSIVKDKIPEGKTLCSLCSRLRRGIIYRVASELGVTKIALGHHQDDIVETLFLNMFFGAKLKAMPAKLASDDGKHIVIRPLAYCREKDIQKYAKGMEFPIIPCNLCGSQQHLQRKQIKHMLSQWEQSTPGRTDMIFKSLQTVVPSHLLDTRLYGFQELSQARDTETLFDEPELPLLGSSHETRGLEDPDGEDSDGEDSGIEGSDKDSKKEVVIPAVWANKP